MPKHILFIVFYFGLVIGLSACLPQTNASTLTIETNDGRSLLFTVEEAITPDEHAQGLMLREEMDKNAGMLFIFEKPGFQNFWMKNTLIPLDILFINKAGNIAHIHHQATPHDLTQIPSQVPALYTLEINGGQASTKGINIGDKVFHNKIKRTLAE